MRQTQTTIVLSTSGKGLYEFTHQLAAWVADSGIQMGLLSLLCRHTSASLLINENAAPAVQRDIARWMETHAPEGADYEHDDEGPDDMPAHLRAMLTGCTLSIPISNGRMTLGTWQGVYLFEHRRARHQRTIVAHLLGE